MRPFRYFLKLTLAFTLRFKRILVASAVFGVLVFFFYSQLAGVFRFFERGEVVGLVGTLSMNDLPLVIQKDISIGLTTIDENNNVAPGIASRWYAEEEGRSWIFILGDYKWQDGTPVLAQDINYEFNDAKTTVLDPKTIKFTLKEPFSPFPSIVSKPLFKKGLIGVGKWKVTKLASLRAKFMQSLRLTNIQNNAIRTYKFYPSQEAVRTAFKLGAIDKIVDLTDPGDLATWKNIKIRGEDQKNRYVAIFFNTQDDLFRNNKTLRQALSYAIKKDFSQKIAISPIPPNSWAYNPQVKQYQYDPKRAEELISAFQKEKGSDKKISINLVTIPSLLWVADKIKADWEAVGIATTIQVTNIQPENFQAFLVTAEVPPDPDQYSMWHSTQPANRNLTRFDNPRIDKLLEDGRRTIDQEERRKIYLDFQRFLMEEVPMIPLFHPISYTVSR